MLSFLKKGKSLTTLSDADLVDLFADSQTREILGEIYHRYGHLVYGTCLKYLKNEADSYDATIDIFEGLITKIPKYAPIKSFNIWIYQVTRNECFARLKSKKKTPVISTESNVLEEKANSFVENNGFLHLYNGTERQLEDKDLHMAIETLKPDQSLCINLFYLEHKTYKEIAEETGLTIKKVKSHIQNGKRKLKIVLTSKIQNNNTL